MSPIATLQAETAVAVHVLGIDPELRVLLDQEAAVADPGTGWSLPAAMLRTGQDPSRLAQQLVRQAGALPRRMDVVAVESEYRLGVHRLDLVFECRAERMWRQAVTGGPLWWSLNEIAGLTLTPRTRKAIIGRWTSIWPNT
jgi:hypothetical protein